MSLRLYAGTNVGLRDNNEDNYTVCPNLSIGKWNVHDDPRQDIPFDGAGCLMVVADGMGGQNAGEVASDIAVKTVREMFASGNLPDDLAWSPDKAKELLRKVIVEANARICAYGDSHKESEGLGSTIVMAWLLGGSVYVAWLGDSRAYSFVPGKGIARLSKDHSYVQQLVDAGKISEEEAMNHPNSNVITRSLGDTSQKAKPDVAEYSVEDGEIIMLCSDGLCGVCSDEEIGFIISENTDNLQACADKLTTQALANGGSDNITITMMQVRDLPVTGEKIHPSLQDYKKKDLLSRIGHVFIALFAMFLIGAVGFGAYHMIKPQEKETQTYKQDTIRKVVKKQTTKRDGFAPKHDNNTPPHLNEELLKALNEANVKPAGNEGETNAGATTSTAAPTKSDAASAGTTTASEAGGQNQ